MQTLLSNYPDLVRAVWWIIVAFVVTTIGGIVIERRNKK